jgi:hypothetical protein
MLFINIDTTEYLVAMAKYPGEISAEIRKALKDGATLLIDESRQLFDEHYDTHTGNAARSIQIDESKTTPTSVTVGINLGVAPYGEYLHEGTKDHMVKPKNAKALHWVGGGSSFFSKGHMVSGIEKYQFIHLAVKNVEEKIVACVESHIRLALAKVGLAE